MNANELADYLLNFIMTVEDYDESKHEKASTMLRQQQAEIEALKAGKIRAYDNGVEDGRKPNTHPVKELTDEEIKQTFQEQTGFYFDDNPADDLALMDFARAILRKASEK